MPKHYSDKQKATVIAQYRESGLSIRAFCRQPKTPSVTALSAWLKEPPPDTAAPRKPRRSAGSSASGARDEVAALYEKLGRVIMENEALKRRLGE